MEASGTCNLCKKALNNKIIFITNKYSKKYMFSESGKVFDPLDLLSVYVLMQILLHILNKQSQKEFKIMQIYGLCLRMWL